MENELRVTFGGGKKVDVHYKGFIIHTDQPLYQGGEGEAPAPFDLFLASIASCAGFYVLSFLSSRGIPEEKARVSMRTIKNKEKKVIEKILIDIELPSDFPSKYQEAIIRAVDTCPVKAHILNPPSFEIKTKIGD